ncbi:MAG: Sau3AI family type II restriction endonuclease [Tractidigestivibacter sp.]|jgi:DNA mismatch repair protein MutH|uniref:Sau3AI family type II restriction endonuclease n=1 Tax=Tractidigestivibacter sp. TaxID=2847320 RepID=UPI003D8C698C
MPDQSLPYDDSKIDSIVEYAQELVGHTLREKTDAPELQSPKKRRGSFGNAIEEYYFEYKPNSDSEPDFPKVGLELKTTPMKRGAHKSLVAKERLVITMIDYMTVVNETFETSHLLDKASKVLLISYLWEKNKDPLDYEVILAELWGLPKEDMPQFKADWETVVNKVRAGHAEDISGSDTLYLEACTKAADSTVRRNQPYSDVLAKPRAWALKASYMTAAENKLLQNRQAIKRDKSERELDLLSLVRKRFEPYIGLTQEQLCSRFHVGKSGERLPKNACALVTKRILGVDKDAEIDEFVKAGIKPKTIRLTRNGRPKEAVSFPAFDYFELEVTPFYESDFYSYLQQMWLFVIYREGNDGEYRLSDLCLWQMPERDIPEAKRCYDQMQKNVRYGRADISVKSTENRCCHVRPHGQNAADVSPQPHGEPVTKKCFWLNQGYLKEEIARKLSDSEVQ